jgi:probable HAF family extracellular repeat protein
MASAQRTRGRRRRLRVLLGGAVVLTALTAATAGASTPTSTDARSQNPSFLLDRGRYTSFEAADPDVQLFPGDINNGGQIVGEYIRPDSESGFVRDRHGRITVFDAPGARGTEAVKINNRGQIVGSWSENTPTVNDPDAKVHGYLRDRGRTITIDAPGAALTTAFGVNDRAQVVGYSQDAAGAIHAYLWDKGRFTNIDVPGASVTQPIDINNRGQIVGLYLDPAGAIHGYLWDKGRVTAVDAPGGPITLLFGINDRGQVVGSSYSDPAGTIRHGFVLRKGVKGPFTAVDFPGAPRTVANGINDRGQIVGAYENPRPAPTRS